MTSPSDRAPDVQNSDAVVEAGHLYVVATPIGNLGDISRRATDVLREVDVLLAEDTRHTGRLLKALGISRSLKSFHQHNENQKAGDLCEMIASGGSVALVSDAGTPLVSDPGFPLVSLAREAGLPVIVIPGPSAVTAALAISGLPVDRFCFEGFLPPKSSARLRALDELTSETRTMVFYEAASRIEASVADMAETFGNERLGFIAREMTKRFEQSLRAPLGALLQWLRESGDHQRGEFVVIVAGNSEASASTDVDGLLKLLLPHLRPRAAAAIVAEHTGRAKNEIYRRALELKD